MKILQWLKSLFGASETKNKNNTEIHLNISNNNILNEEEKDSRTEKNLNTRREDNCVQYNWQDVEISVIKMKNRLLKETYTPTLVVGIGRGGAVLGGLISGVFGKLPIVVMFYEYHKEKSKITCETNIMVNIPENYSDKVLIVVGDIVTGRGMNTFIEAVKEMGAKEVRVYSFAYVRTTSEYTPDYYSHELNTPEFKFPWMIDEAYRRDSRGE
ncbi:phosphoribosyltransferase [Capnocytophaga canis]|uniref:phosphoribosyltransferase n=1 Tax=Capnocytophaga canis TaxID=1848903 RepID=UPI0037CEC609